VVRFEHDIPVACALYGGATASYHTDELQGFSKSFPTRDALFIAGGSRVGLAAAAWAVVSALSEQGVGLPGKVPLPGVSGAIIYDLGLRERAFNPAFAREALDDCSDLPVARGNVGAGVGATVGKLKMTRDGLLQAMKAGVGCARINLPNGAMVCALSVVNARGNVIAADGSILAGNRDEANAHGFISFEDVFDNTARPADSTNTTVTIVGTNVKLPAHEDYQRVAHLATHGHVRAIDPVHSAADGDVVFIFSTETHDGRFASEPPPRSVLGWHKFTVDVLGQTAARAVRSSVYDACLSVESIPYAAAYDGVIPAAGDYCRKSP
jgi:L-aminopeptidase/D-esterase-like protein